MTPTRIAAYTLTTALGRGQAAHLAALTVGRGGLRRIATDELPSGSWLGVVEGLDDSPLPADLAAYDCRNNRLAHVALAQDGFAERVHTLREQVGPARIGVFLGTSTSGIQHTEQCYRRHFEAMTPGLDDDLRFAQTHSYFSVAAFCRRALGLRGPAAVISTACSSGARTFATAQRALAVGLCDAAVVGGVDSLCATTLLGFQSLGLLSPRPCSPWGEDRGGLSLGEGAAFALLDSRCDSRWTDAARLALLGYGESNDAHHIATPHPEGFGAMLAMQAALTAAGLRPDEIDYINLHGTGTPANDLSEDRAIGAVFGLPLLASGTKGWTGHTLGASGAIEAALSLLCVENAIVPGTLGTRTLDPALALRPILTTIARPVERTLSSSFGLGGDNCCLILGRY